MQNRFSLAHPESGRVDPTQPDEQIRRRAYEIYEERGCQNNRALEHWLEAKAEILDTVRKPRARAA